MTAKYTSSVSPFMHDSNYLLEPDVSDTYDISESSYSSDCKKVLTVRMVEILATPVTALTVEPVDSRYSSKIGDGSDCSYNSNSTDI